MSVETKRLQDKFDRSIEPTHRAEHRARQLGAKEEAPKEKAPPREQGPGGEGAPRGAKVEGAEASSLHAMLAQLSQQVTQLAAQGASREGQGSEQREGPTAPQGTTLEGKLEGKLETLSELVRGLAAREAARHAAPEGEHGASHRPAAAEAEGVATLRANLEVISQQVRQVALNPHPHPNPVTLTVSS